MASIKFVKSIKRWRIWWHITLPDGKIVKGSKTFLDRKLAEDFYSATERQEQLWKGGVTSPAHAIELIKARWYAHIKQNMTTRTQGHYKPVIEEFFDSLPPMVQNCDQLTAAHIRDHLQTRILDQGFANGTYNRHLTPIKSFCRFMSEMLNLPNPTASIKKRKEIEPQARFLNKDEYKKLLEVWLPPLKDVAVFLAHTGLRVSELVELKWLHLNHDNSAITFHGKGQKKRTVGLNAAAKAVIERLKTEQKDLLPEHPIFILKSKPWNRYKLYNHLATAAKQAKIDKFGPHALRHFFATQLLLAGVPIIKVSALLGHASVTTTQKHYSHILDADLRSVTDALL